MIELRKDLPLIPKPLQKKIAVQSGPDEFDGHFSPILIVCSSGKKDFRHPASAKLANDFVRSNTVFSRRVQRQKVYLAVAKSLCVLEIIVVVIVGAMVAQQRLHLGSKLDISAAGLVYKRMALGGWLFESNGQHCFDFLPTLASRFLILGFQF